MLYIESKFSLSLPIYRWKNHDNDSKQAGYEKSKSKGVLDGVLLSVFGETPGDGEGKSSWHKLLVKIVGVVIARITARSHGVEPRNAYYKLSQ